MNPITSIETIISDISRGKMVIIVDDENRENEGDVIVAAQTVTRKQIAFMLKEVSGLFCIPVAYQLMNKFGFRLLPRKYCRSTNCYFAVPVDLRGNEITTGVSASDRHKLVKKLLDQDVTQRNFETPGYSFPLIARPNGILERQGHTEAVVEIVQLAGFLPIGITVEIVKEDGEMARLPDLITFARYHNLHIGTIADLLRYKTSQLDTSRTPSAVDR